MPLLAGCGLPDSYYLQPPLVQNLAGSVSTNFEFLNPDHSGDLSVSFQGFDLYYQFYASSTDININAYDAGDYHDAATQLTSKGFFPLCRVEDTPFSRQSPAVPVAIAVRTNSFPVDLFVNFGTPPNVLSYYAYTPPSTLITVTDEVRRYAQDPNAGFGYKSFAANSYRIITPPNYPDSDINPQVWSDVVNGSGFAYIAMYAMSYGLAGGTTPLWSTPVYLGFLYVQIN
jgi:hypothetical protein